MWLMLLTPSSEECSVKYLGDGEPEALTLLRLGWSGGNVGKKMRKKGRSRRSTAIAYAKNVVRLSAMVAVSVFVYLYLVLPLDPGSLMLATCV
jgi:hypothetical protein